MTDGAVMGSQYQPAISFLDLETYQRIQNLEDQGGKKKPLRWPLRHLRKPAKNGFSRWSINLTGWLRPGKC
jgi:hypothetical protein